MTYENLDVKLIDTLLGDDRTSLRSLTKGLDASITTVSNHLQDLGDRGIIEGYALRVNYSTLDYDVTTIIQLKVESPTPPKITECLRAEKRVTSVYEVTSDYDIIAIDKSHDTGGISTQIKKLFTDADIHESNTSAVLDAITENEWFNLDLEE